MNDDIDALMVTKPLVAPPDFVERLTVLTESIPQVQRQSPVAMSWQWASLSAGAGFGVVLLCEFIFVAFITVGAH